MYEDDEHKACRKTSDADYNIPESVDQYINAEVLLQHGNQMITSKVKQGKRDKDGNLNSNEVARSQTSLEEHCKSSFDLLRKRLHPAHQPTNGCRSHPRQ